MSKKTESTLISIKIYDINNELVLKMYPIPSVYKIHVCS